MIINDGTGTGRTAAVSNLNHLKVTAVSQSVEHFANHVLGTAFSILIKAVTPTGADSCFFYLKNTSDQDLTIEGFWIKLAADEYIDIVLGDTGTPAGGNDITPVNLNLGSGKSFEGIVQYGSDITGLSGGSTAYRIYHANSLETIRYNFDQDIIFPKNGVVTAYCETGTTELSMGLDANYHTRHS